jgi:hypothetical protein
MLGEKIGQETGKITSRRVLSVDGSPKVEISFEAAGTVLGVKHQTIATYQSELRADGTIYGEANGLVMGAGGEMATFKGGGVGAFDGKGGVTFRGAIYYSTSAPAWVKLNKVGIVFEYSEDPTGATKADLWEWR